MSLAQSQMLMGYFAFTTVASLGLTVVGLFRLRAATPNATTYRTPFYPWTPVFFLVMIALVLLLLAGGRPRETGLGVAVVLLGVPVYLLLTRRSRS
jgi:APA family basic amino acid/polyamine antiporter